MNQYNKKYLSAFIVALLLVIGFVSFKNSRDIPSNGDKWQAVFLSDGQVYFGQLGNKNTRFASLKNVYYLKFAEGLQQEKVGGTSALSSRNLNLIKLGGEAHGPESEMFISKDQILFFENLKDNSTVVQAILNNGK
jgi:hypothetical protein